MGGANRVDVVLLHHFEVFFDPAHAHSATVAVIVVVAVDAVHFEVPAVDVHEAVNYPDIPEA